MKGFVSILKTDDGADVPPDCTLQLRTPNQLITLNVKITIWTGKNSTLQHFLELAHLSS